MRRLISVGGATLAAAAISIAAPACGLSGKMNFFVTSVPVGDGGNIGGLAGADTHCEALAAAAGSKRHDWHAYLSATAEGGHAAINARDRIGSGPWFNAKGMTIAESLEDLHGSGNRVGGRTSLDEHGEFIGAGAHDILTGSKEDGTVADGDLTCHNWTSTAGHAMVGHSNKVGSIGGDRAKSWNSAHETDGCTAAEFRKLGGNALLYCFAKN